MIFLSEMISSNTSWTTFFVFKTYEIFAFGFIFSEIHQKWGIYQEDLCSYDFIYISIISVLFVWSPFSKSEWSNIKVRTMPGMLIHVGVNS